MTDDGEILARNPACGAEVNIRPGSVALDRPLSLSSGQLDAPVQIDGSISKRLPSLLTRVVSELMDAVSPYFRRLGLSIPAARTLIAIVEGGGLMTVGQIADTTSIDLSTTSHVLRRLEAKGYIERERRKDDNRVVYASLTASGRRLAEECRQASLRHEALLIGSMPDEDVKNLKRLLDQVYRNARQNLMKE